MGNENRTISNSKSKLMGLTALSGNRKPTGTGDTGGGGGDTVNPVAS